MIQVAFKMKLKPGYRQEYIRRHNELWPEMKTLLHNNGITDYSIFLDAETDILFAIQKTNTDLQGGLVDPAGVLQKWWDQMADIMDVNPDNSPVVKPLERVFYFE
jgi:L-rhamnose mutarotase